jgi:hypothetical protein
MATFTPPTVSGVPSILPTSRGVEEHLFRHVRPLSRGVNVFKMPAGTYLTDQQPRQLSNPDPANHTDDAVTPVITYYGGHSYTVDANEAAALSAAGFSANLT